MSAKNMKGALGGVLSNVTAEFFKEKQRAAAQKRDELTRGQIVYLVRRKSDNEIIKDAAYEVMTAVYMKTSENGTLPANARQIMYVARDLVLAKIGKCWEKSSYFTQTLLPDFVSDFPQRTAGWDVVYDARGHLVEPHVKNELGLGTIEVRSYVDSWSAVKDELDDLEIDIDELYPTCGPKNRYKFALFIEKEGFGPLLARAKIAERFDIAIFSSKGMPTTATRQLVNALSRAGVTILMVHDFDISGLGIAHTLSHNTRRYTFRVKPKVIDLGLRLGDVKAMNLQSEPVQINNNPSERLRRYGATQEEQDFLVVLDRQHWSRSGRRVELNAMLPAQFVAWLERKLVEAGVEKVVPDEKTFVAAWRRARLIAHVKESLEMLKAASEKYPPIPPDDLESRVREQLAADPALAWDEVLALCNWDDPDESE
jgi:hypothetical protein